MAIVTFGFFERETKKFRVRANLMKGKPDPLELVEIYERLASLGEFVLEHSSSIAQQDISDVTKLFEAMIVFGGSRRDLEDLLKKRHTLDVLLETEEIFFKELYGYDKTPTLEVVSGDETSVEEQKEEEAMVPSLDEQMKSFRKEFDRLVGNLDMVPIDFVMNKKHLYDLGLTPDMVDIYNAAMDRAKSGKDDVLNLFLTKDFSGEELEEWAKYLHNMRVLLYKASRLVNSKNAQELKEAIDGLSMTYDLIDKKYGQDRAIG